MLDINVSEETVAKYMIKRECLDHMIILYELHLRRVLRDCLTGEKTAREENELPRGSGHRSP